MQTENRPLSIYRADHGKQNPYFMFRRETAQDRSLSFEARGMLAYLMSQPDNWVIKTRDLEQGCKKDKVHSIIDELEKAGYVKREEVKDGKWADGRWRYAAFEYPCTESPYPEKPATDKTAPYIIENKNTESKAFVPKGTHAFPHPQPKSENGENKTPDSVALFEKALDEKTEVPACHDVVTDYLYAWDTPEVVGQYHRPVHTTAGDPNTFCGKTVPGGHFTPDPTMLYEPCLECFPVKNDEPEGLRLSVPETSDKPSDSPATPPETPPGYQMLCSSASDAPIHLRRAGASILAGPLCGGPLKCRTEYDRNFANRPTCPECWRRAIEQIALASKPKLPTPGEMIDAFCLGFDKNNLPPGFSFQPFVRFAQKLQAEGFTPDNLRCAGEVYGAWHKAVGSPVLDWSAGETITAIRSALALCKRGITPDKVRQVTLEIRSDKFWRDKFIPFSKISKEVSGVRLLREQGYDDDGTPNGGYR